VSETPKPAPIDEKVVSSPRRPWNRPKPESRRTAAGRLKHPNPHRHRQTGGTEGWAKRSGLYQLPDAPRSRAALATNRPGQTASVAQGWAAKKYPDNHIHVHPAVRPICRRPRANRKPPPPQPNLSRPQPAGNHRHQTADCRARTRRATPTEAVQDFIAGFDGTGCFCQT